MEIEDEKELDIIQAEQSFDDQERAKRMLKLWRNKQIDASWNRLIKVLRIPSIGLLTTALEIEGMLLPESMQHVFNNCDQVCNNQPSPCNKSAHFLPLALLHTQMKII